MEQLTITLKNNNKLLQGYYKVLEAVAGTEATRKAVLQQIDSNNAVIRQNNDINTTPAPKRTKEEQYIYDTYLRNNREPIEENKPTKQYGGALILANFGYDLKDYKGAVAPINKALEVMSEQDINTLFAKITPYIKGGKVKNGVGYIVQSLKTEMAVRKGGIKWKDI